MDAETEAQLRKAISRELIDHKLPRHLMLDFIMRMSDDLGDNYHLQLDKESHMMEILQNHPLITSIGATKYDVIIWFMKAIKKL